MKVVFDTNVYISEALFNALAEIILKAGRSGKFSIYISDYILTETYRVLVVHFHTSRRFASLTVERAKRLARLVVTRGRVIGCLPDAKDHPILETAMNCGADFLVTGDKVLRSLSPYQGVTILGLRDFHSVLKAAALL